MPDPPINRVGYLLDGFGAGGAGGTEIRCNGCHEWFPVAPVCPFCGRARPGFNKHIRTSQLNEHLYSMAEQQTKGRR